MAERSGCDSVVARGGQFFVVGPVQLDTQWTITMETCWENKGLWGGGGGGVTSWGFVKCPGFNHCGPET